MKYYTGVSMDCLDCGRSHGKGACVERDGRPMTISCTRCGEDHVLKYSASGGCWVTDCQKMAHSEPLLEHLVQWLTDDSCPFCPHPDHTKLCHCGCELSDSDIEEEDVCPDCEADHDEECSCSQETKDQRRMDDHLVWLKDNDFRYHFDDGIEDNMWGWDKLPTPEQLEHIVTEHEWMMDSDLDVWDRVTEVWSDLFE